MLVIYIYFSTFFFLSVFTKSVRFFKHIFYKGHLHNLHSQSEPVIPYFNFRLAKIIKNLQFYFLMRNFLMNHTILDNLFERSEKRIRQLMLTPRNNTYRSHFWTGQLLERFTLLLTFRSLTCRNMFTFLCILLGNPFNPDCESGLLSISISKECVMLSQHKKGNIADDAASICFVFFCYLFLASFSCGFQNKPAPEEV